MLWYTKEKNLWMKTMRRNEYKFEEIVRVSWESGLKEKYNQELINFGCEIDICVYSLTWLLQSQRHSNWEPISQQ